MSQYKLKLDDIEEVESTPRRRRRHNKSNMNNNYKTINSSYEYVQNRDINNINRNFDINNNTYNQHQHHHQHRNRRPQWEEFGCKQALLMTVFVFSLSVLFLSFLVNLILTIKQVITPRFFIPSIILIILSFMFSGGLMGTYIVPPMRMHRPKFRELLMMRTIIPTIMLVVSIIFLIVGADNVKSMKKDINKSEDLCNKSKGLSMQEIYIKANETMKELIEQKNNIVYSYNNNLICFPKGKCIKLNQEENKYLCNSQDFISDDSNKIKCETINADDNKNNLLKNLKNDKNAYLFLENCIDVNKNLVKLNNNLFKCESEYDLEIIKFSKNLTHAQDVRIEDYLNNKIKKNENAIKRNKEIIKKYEYSKYDYDLECLAKNEYRISYIMINLYLIIFYLLGIFWIFYGLYSMHYLIKLGVDGKLVPIFNEFDNENMNINNDINSKIDDGEVHQLITINK